MADNTPEPISGGVPGAFGIDTTTEAPAEPVALETDGTQVRAGQTFTPKKATKAHVGAVIALIATFLAAGSQSLPSPWADYGSGIVIVLGVVCSWFGIYLPANKPKA